MDFAVVGFGVTTAVVVVVVESAGGGVEVPPVADVSGVTVPSVVDGAGVEVLPVELGVVVEVVGCVVASVASASATTGRADPDDRTDTDEPLLEFAAGCLPVERVRAGPADALVRLGVAEWRELLPELFDDCGADPESDEPPSVEAAATPWPTPTARLSPTAAAKMPLRAARFRLRATTFRCRAACFLWRPACFFFEATDSPDSETWHASYPPQV
ncbi:conserved hypothetical protein [uncultured Mycobacterium sp.]|uniref:Uncharacterized protein n=1 Tax=uncultured Mycobacterium sp. TaxID=171292 RepID=A0A1Y5PIE0_9MYCO|nr:conserved hypothetical protein [uncultured Mycobacterium sp.]